ncbi:unnamed protein product [Blepharisma stoltei]|uniref:CHCH domain-containing protein n=1 Tax=Blepharisma stoltei TaxID=1481888 RepID=A0AAU9J5A9_9CILI|nr:unnamed protein product [Blepharisma stoltei]
MPRKSGGMKSSGFSRSSGPTRSAKTAQAPQQTYQAPPMQQSPGMVGSLAGTLMQGVAFGAGSEVAHQAVRGLMGSGSSHAQEAQVQSQPQQIQEPCSQHNQDFLNCLQFNKNEIGMCQSYLDLYKQCKGQF